MPSHHFVMLQAIPLLAALVLIVSGCLSPALSALASPLSTSLSAPLIGAMFSFSGDRPTNLGVQAGQLAACPATPNCVNSQSQDDAHAIAPLRYKSSSETALSLLKSVIQAQPRTRIIQAGDRYLYAEATSAIMGFVDDVEFYLDPKATVIQVRSASRLGESDLGVNRQRIEAIRQAFEAQANS